jgi:hypothetical protein
MGFQTALRPSVNRVAAEVLSGSDVTSVPFLLCDQVTGSAEFESDGESHS